MDDEKIDKDEFELILMKNHHKEMINAVKGIKLPEAKDNSELINKLESAIKLLTVKLDTLQSPKITVEKTEINQKEVVNLLQDLIKEVKALKVTEVKEKKDWTFNVIRDINGNIQSVKTN
mgnify:CR=1 FL=1